MNGIRVIGTIVLIPGFLALVYGGFTCTRSTHDADLGPIEIEIKDEERAYLGRRRGDRGGGSPVAVRPVEKSTPRTLVDRLLS